MIWILFMLPLMLLGVAIATLPLVLTMLREHRAAVASRARHAAVTTFGATPADRALDRAA